MGTSVRLIFWYFLSLHILNGISMNFFTLETWVFKSEDKHQEWCYFVTLFSLDVCLTRAFMCYFLFCFLYRRTIIHTICTMYERFFIENSLEKVCACKAISSILFKTSANRFSFAIFLIKVALMETKRTPFEHFGCWKCQVRQIQTTGMWSNTCTPNWNDLTSNRFQLIRQSCVIFVRLLSFLFFVKKSKRVNNVELLHSNARFYYYCIAFPHNRNILIQLCSEERTKEGGFMHDSNRVEIMYRIACCFSNAICLHTRHTGSAPKHISLASLK